MPLAKRVRVGVPGGALTELAQQCRSAKLVIELDGGQHAESTTDPARTTLIEAHGYTVLRFWNDDVLRDLDNVCQHIVIAAGLTAQDARAQAAGRTLGVQS